MIDKNLLFLPFRNLKRFLLGVFLFALSELIIPPIFAFGYIVNTYQNFQKEINELPPWNQWINIGKKGLFSIIILILYFVPSAILLLLGITFFTIKIQILGYIFLLLAGLFSFIVIFFIPLILFEYSKTEEIKATLHILKLFKIFKEKPLAYLINWGILVLIGLPFSIIMLLLKISLPESLLLDVVLAMIGGFSQFLIFILMAILFGSLFSKSDEKEKKQEKTTKPTPTKQATKQSDTKDVTKEFCHNCGAEVIKKGNFCISCGAKL